MSHEKSGDAKKRLAKKNARLAKESKEISAREDVLKGADESAKARAKQAADELAKRDRKSLPP